MRRRASGEGDRVSQRSREVRRIADVISDLLARRGYAQVQTADECREAWQKVAGPLADGSIAGPLQRGVLQIYARNSILLQELTFRKQGLLESLQRELPHHRIRDLRFRIEGG